ncbi:selenide, water dikinase SelD [bacterium]|nr:selenide, water dikinase SelD [bacterium]
MLANLPDTRHPDLLVGYETADDAAVCRVDAGLAIVSTADFITPIVDDARTFGALAAANSLSDVYAMGGRPIMALNLLGYPQGEIPPEVIGEILAGAAEKCREAGAAIGGGHTVRDTEVKFGLAVTGVVDPGRMLLNTAARPGDRLVLTKPLGTGALAAAFKKGALDESGPDYAALVETMTSLNACGAILAGHGVAAATDITGFGLTGHALEMAAGSGVSLAIDTSGLPLLPDAVGLCGRGFTCGGTRSNRDHTARRIDYGSLDEAMIDLVNDPQTSGGLLFCVPADRCDEAREAALAAGAACVALIGEVRPGVARGPALLFS